MAVELDVLHALVLTLDEHLALAPELDELRALMLALGGRLVLVLSKQLALTLTFDVQANLPLLLRPTASQSCNAVAARGEAT